MTNDAQTVAPVADLLAPASGAAPAADECREALARVTAERNAANEQCAHMTEAFFVQRRKHGEYRNRALALVRQGRLNRTRIRDAKKDAEGWRQEWRMYRNAWVRELGGRLVAKTHEIDALVLTTEALRNRANRAEAERDALAGQLAAVGRAQLERDCAVLCEECRSPDDAEPMVRQGPAELINGIWYHRRFVKSGGVELGPVRCRARRLRTAALAGADTLGGGAGIDA